tara:strand:- start:277 stop:510 length:234 start_codon:yes stop_codon:yes gene_type:complete
LKLLTNQIHAQSGVVLTAWHKHIWTDAVDEVIGIDGKTYKKPIKQPYDVDVKPTSMILLLASIGPSLKTIKTQTITL